LVPGVEENFACDSIAGNLSGASLELIVDLLDLGIGIEVGALWQARM
jgi:hypothetical protein